MDLKGFFNNIVVISILILIFYAALMGLIGYVCVLMSPFLMPTP